MIIVHLFLLAVAGIVAAWILYLGFCAIIWVLILTYRVLKSFTKFASTK